MKVTDHYRSRGFSDSGIIRDFDDKQDMDDDSQELQAGDQTTGYSCTISSSTKNRASLAIQSFSVYSSKLESPMQVIFSPSEDAHPTKQAPGIVFALPPTKSIRSKKTAAKGTETNSTKPTDDRSYKTATERSGQSNFNDTHNNGDDAPLNSHTLEPQEGCVANNAQDADG